MEEIIITHVKYETVLKPLPVEEVDPEIMREAAEYIENRIEQMIFAQLQYPSDTSFPSLSAATPTVLSQNVLRE